MGVCINVKEYIIMKTLYTPTDNIHAADLVANPMAGGYAGKGTVFLQKVEPESEQEIQKLWKRYESHMKLATGIVKKIMEMRNAQEQ